MDLGVCWWLGIVSLVSVILSLTFTLVTIRSHDDECNYYPREGQRTRISSRPLFTRSCCARRNWFFKGSIATRVQWVICAERHR